MLLRRNPWALKAMQTHHPDGSTTIRFPGGAQHAVRVHPDEYASLPNNGPVRPPQVMTDDNDIRLAETAYARWLKTHYPRRFKNADPENIRSVFQQRGFDSDFFNTAFAYKLLTGKDMRMTVKAGVPGYFNLCKKDRAAQANAYEKDVRETLGAFAKNPDSKDIILISNPTPPDLIDLKNRMQYTDISKKILSFHAFVVDEVDLKNDRVLLRDPHNTRIGLMLPMDDAVDLFYKMYVAEYP